MSIKVSRLGRVSVGAPFAGRVAWKREAADETRESSRHPTYLGRMYILGHERHLSIKKGALQDEAADP